MPGTTQTLDFINLHLTADLKMKVLYTFLLLLLVVGIRILVRNMIEHWKIPNPKMKQKWIQLQRRLVLFIFVIGIVLIWPNSLKGIEITLIAMAAGLVIASKEFLLCMWGSVIKASSSAFTIGDRIAVGDVRGLVVDQTILATTLMEIGPGRHSHQFTGSTIVLPNSLFLIQPTKKESFGGAYALQSFQVCIPRGVNWKKAHDALLHIAEEVCQPFQEKADLAIRQRSREKAFHQTSTKVRISIDLSSYEKITFTVRIPSVVSKSNRIEQGIIYRFLEAGFGFKDDAV